MACVVVLNWELKVNAGPADGSAVYAVGNELKLNSRGSVTQELVTTVISCRFKAPAESSRRSLQVLLWTRKCWNARFPAAPTLGSYIAELLWTSGFWKLLLRIGTGIF